MLRVAVIDCGILGPVADRRTFAEDGQERASVAPGAAHGSIVAEIIAHMAPRAEVLDAQVFTERPATTATAVAAALAWAVAEGASVVNLSLGLSHDRPVLATACAEAVAAGVLVVASSPARGGPVYPAASPGVIRVCGDARCTPGTFSALNTAQADFGACVYAPDARHGDPTRSGASFAAAYVSGRLAALLEQGEGHAVERLREECRWHGPERRT